MPTFFCLSIQKARQLSSHETNMTLWDFKAFLVCKVALQFVETEPNYKIFYESVIMITVLFWLLILKTGQISGHACSTEKQKILVIFYIFNIEFETKALFCIEQVSMAHNNQCKTVKADWREGSGWWQDILL